MKLIITKNMKTKPLNRHWQFCVGSGHASMALRADYLEQLKKVHEELGIERVRFHGIFHDDIQVYMNLADMMPLPGAEKFSTVSFRKIGMVYENLLACGMKLFVELSFMPKHLGKSDAQTALYYGGCIAPPKDDETWKEWIQSFVKYLIGRFGAEEVESWPFEVWNEPDVFVFWAGTKEEYYHMYEVTARAVKEIDPKIQVGGPAASGSKWVGSFLEYCREHDVPVDFISVHQYAGDPIGGVEASESLEEELDPSEVTADPSVMAQIFSKAEGGSFLEGLRMMMPDKSELTDVPGDAFRKNAAIVKKQADGLPVYYTEWNENAIFSSYTNDTRKPAAYIVKTALATEKLVTGSSVWCFSDIFEECSEIHEEFHGGFGLLTHSGIPKPAYQAMKLLAELCDNRIITGDAEENGSAEPGDESIRNVQRKAENGIEAAAFMDVPEHPGKIQILLYRQKMKNLPLPKESTTVEIELEEHPQNVWLERIDEEHCNPLRLWEEMGSPQELNRTQKAEMLEKSALKKEKAEYVYESGKLTLTAELGTNDVWMFTIIC